MKDKDKRKLEGWKKELDEAVKALNDWEKAWNDSEEPTEEEIDRAGYIDKLIKGDE